MSYSQKHKSRPNNQKTGAFGEDLAINWLIECQYEIRERNWRFGRYEIDIIAIKDGLMHFIEVKTLHSEAFFGNATEKISKSKIKHIVRAASGYLGRTKWNGDIQFDALSIVLNTHPTVIELIEDIWP